jgi:transcriptional regulator with XRE-family HTH domain
MTIKNQIGKSIQLWRKQRKMTQEDFADLVGISVHAISSIERGVNSPALKTIEKISKVLNVPISEFYRSEDKKENVKKQELISAILGILHKLNDDELEIILKQVGAFDSK